MNSFASIGIVGAGTIAKQHVKAAVAAGIEVKYVVDTDQTRAEELSSSCSATATNQLDLALADADLGGVIVAIPNRFHCPVAIQALKAGKDVLLEKPMGLNAEECKQINAAAEQYGRFVQVGLVHRYTAVGTCARQLVDAGRLGDVYHAKAQLYRRRGVPGLGGWFTTKSVSGGGAIIDVGVHVIDLTLHLMGFPKVKQVLGKVYNKFGCRMENYVFEDMWAGPPQLDGVCDVEDSAHALILFENSATLELNVTWAGNFPPESVPESMIGFFGDQGGMSFALDGDHVMLAAEEDGMNVDKRFNLPKRDQFREQIVDFVESIASRKVNGATGIEATTVQSIIDAVYDSSEKNCAVDL